MPIIKKAFAIWLLILLLAVMNGALREAVFISQFGFQSAMLISGLLLSAFILLVTFLTWPWLKVQQLSHAFGIGLFWLLLTLLFEFSFGRWQGKSWIELLDTYRLKDGNLWPLVLLFTTLSPYITFKIRGLR